MHRRQSTMTLGKASPGTPPYDSAIYTISPSSSAHLTIIRHRQHWKADTAPQSAAILSHIWHAAENARTGCPFSRHRKHSAYERPGAHYAPVIAEAQDTSRRVQATMRRRRPRLWHAWGQKLCGGYAWSRLRASGRGLPHRVVRLSHAQAYGRVRQAS